jgi:hypothetical protein
MLEKNQTQEMVEIPHEYLIEGVRKAGNDVKSYMERSRAKYGNRYNEKNDYEVFGRRFGYQRHEDIWKEFLLVANKQSKEPAVIRNVITVLGNTARNHAILRMRQEYQEQEKKNEK